MVSDRLKLAVPLVIVSIGIIGGILFIAFGLVGLFTGQTTLRAALPLLFFGIFEVAVGSFIFFQIWKGRG